MSGRKIFVGSLPDGVSEATLRSTFQSYGQIEDGTDTYIKQGCEPGRQWAFITFATAEQAMSAKEQCDRALTFPGMDRPCDVMVARTESGDVWPALRRRWRRWILAPATGRACGGRGPQEDLRGVAAGRHDGGAAADRVLQVWRDHRHVPQGGPGCEPGRQWAFVTFSSGHEAQLAKVSTDRLLFMPGAARPCEVTLARNQGMYGQGQERWAPFSCRRTRAGCSWAEEDLRWLPSGRLFGARCCGRSLAPSGTSPRCFSSRGASQGASGPSSRSPRPSRPRTRRRRLTASCSSPGPRRRARSCSRKTRACTGRTLLVGKAEAVAVTTRSRRGWSPSGSSDDGRVRRQEWRRVWQGRWRLWKGASGAASSAHHVEPAPLEVSARARRVGTDPGCASGCRDFAPRPYIFTSAPWASPPTSSALDIGAMPDEKKEKKERTDGPSRADLRTQQPELEHERKRMAELLEPADQSDIADLRQHINETKQEFMGALAKVEESMGALSKSIKRGWESMDHKLESRLTAFDERHSAQEARIDVMEAQIRSLQAALDVVKSDNPVPPPTSINFDREIDHSILIFRTKLSSTQSDVLASLQGWLQRANLDPTEYEMESEPTTTKHIMRIKGSRPYGARKVQQALGALRKANNEWERFSVLSAGSQQQQEIFIPPDKNQEPAISFSNENLAYFGISKPALSDAIKVWRATKDPIISPILSSMTEIDTPDPAHYNKDLGTLNTIDRIPVSFPGWVCNQVHISGQVVEYPEVLSSKGISDHARLVVEIARSFPIPARSSVREPISVTFRRPLSEAFRGTWTPRCTPLQNVRTFTFAANELMFAFMFEGGIIQGCPASGALYAIAPRAFLADVDKILTPGAATGFMGSLELVRMTSGQHYTRWLIFVD
ncbi:unnamed protein product [Prorocentrum cordatum]|uniref:RRM domain-containing protein n=1 Tax=Prorocentrum cordatum TaxID=2364126 RepID=A0ABN9QQB8_9DINO|nr:unnamed protein product [Polarella glacialis]